MKAIYCYNNKITYASIVMAARELSLNKVRIKEALRDRQVRHVKGFYFSYASDIMKGFVIPSTFIDKKGGIQLDRASNKNIKAVNYKSLLKRYIGHVKNMEGISMIHTLMSNEFGGPEFSEEEIKSLIELDESTDERN